MLQLASDIPVAMSKEWSESIVWKDTRMRTSRARERQVREEEEKRAAAAIRQQRRALVQLIETIATTLGENEGQAKEQIKRSVEFLGVADAVQARQVLEQHLVHDVLPQKSRRIGTYDRVHHGLREATVVQVVDELRVQCIDVVRQVGGRAGGGRLAVAHEHLLLLRKAQVLGEGQGRQHELGETAGT